jgi:hypothetical protein
VCGGGQRAHALAERRHLDAASSASAEVAPHLAVHARVERAEQMFGELVSNVLAPHGSTPASPRADSCIASRSFSNAVRILVLAVPTGIPSSSATSALVFPPK